MTLCIISAIRRYAAFDEPSSFIYVVNLDERRVLQRSVMVDPPYRELDPNPRGGLRGAKGISIREDQIAISNGSMVFRYDPQWNLLGAITHPTCACIHDILYNDDTLWVTSSQTDFLFQFDLSGNIQNFHNARHFSSVSKEIGWNPPIRMTEESVTLGKIDFRNPSTHDKQTYNRAHINSVAVLSGGDLLVSMGLIIGDQYASMLRLKSRLIKIGVWSALMRGNRKLRTFLGMKEDMHSDLVVKPGGAKSAVVRISKSGDNKLLLLLPEINAPSHSLLALPEGNVVYLNTTLGSVMVFEPDTRNNSYSEKITDGFLRGVGLLPGRKLVMGSNGVILTYDLKSKRVLDRITFSDDPRESVYDIKVLPPHYALPPTNFDEHFKKCMGFRPAEMIMNDLAYKPDGELKV